ncbi:MAG TPA: biliverdin-producing heme oxygenase [Chroococcales cyanobacterium]
MTGIALKLKEHTRSAHNSAEHHSFQRSLGGGTLSLDLYRAYLTQLWLIHTSLEESLQNAGRASNKVKAVITDEQMQCKWLVSDLKSLAVDTAAVSPVESTRDIVARIERTASSCPVALLGYHYVLLGSKHGGKYIAAVIKQKHNLNGGGTLYFDPYGQEFQKHWQHFTTQMNELELSESETAQMVQAADDMFRAVESVGAELEKTV